MSALDDLAPDQRAVLQMVLARGRSYDEIAGMLSIDREAVRRRALDALDALTPAGVIAGPGRAQVTDYLLGQLPEPQVEQVQAHLRSSDRDREWARAIAEVIAPLASGSLPEIPVGAPLGADDSSVGGLELREGRPSSRRGGAILLGTIGVLIVAGILVAVLSSGGASTNPGRKSYSGPATTARTTTTPLSTGTSTSATEQPLAQLNLTSPKGASATVGIVQVVRIDGKIAIIVAAQGVPRNPAHTAYAVWLYNSASSYRFVDFFRDLVGKDGKLAGAGALKPGASAYHRILITLETRKKPTKPGEVILSGPFREHS